MMIQKISLSDSNYKSQVAKQKKQDAVKNQTNSINFEGTKGKASQLASLYQAQNGIKMASTLNFGARAEALTELEQSIIGAKEISVKNLFDLEEDIDIKSIDMPEGKSHLNAAGLHIKSEQDGMISKVTITNDKGDTIFVGESDPGANVPEVEYKQGKYMPEITVKSYMLHDKSVKMLAGSELKGEGFRYVMPGKYQPSGDSSHKNISFTGRTVITTLNKEERTLNAVDSYKNSGLAKETIHGDFYDVVKDNDPTVVIPAGGFGERFYNITGERENKPSGKLPTSDDYRIIATTLNAAASAGIIQGNGKDDITYLSQMHEIDGDDVVQVGKYRTDGGAIAEGLSRDAIRNDKDVIVLNADIFTNADITRPYNALKTLPDAALVIPYYPVDPKRAKAFGLLGIEQDANNNLQIKSFVEKPKYTSDAPLPSDFRDHGDYDKAMTEFRKVQGATHPDDEQKFLANPGMYFISKEAAKILMAQGIIDSTQTGLGAHTMPKIVEMANEGKLLDKDGNKLKAYTVPMEAKGGKPAVWDDIGTAEAYLGLIKDVAYEVEKHGFTESNKYYGAPEFVLNDFRNNVDLETGIVYDSKEAREVFENFKQEYYVTRAKGNMFIAE